MTIRDTPTDRLIEALSVLRFQLRGSSMNRRVRQTVSIKIRAIELTLAERGLSAEAVAAIK